MENKLKKFNELKALVEKLEVDITKFFEKGNETAGTRASKGMQELKIVAKDVRLGIFDEKKIILAKKLEEKEKRKNDSNNSK